MKNEKEMNTEKCKVNCCAYHGASPVPQEGNYGCICEVKDISGFSHSVGTCAMKQGACKLTTNVKNGIIQEALIEVIGCSGMTQSAAIASEVLPGKTVLEAMNTALACDAINVAMREQFLNLAFGRSQSAFTKGGLNVGSAFDDLGDCKSSMVGTSYGSVDNGPRYLNISEGYVRKLALDDKNRIIGYQYTNLGKMMELIDGGIDSAEALTLATGEYGQYQNAVKYINPRKQ